jgi:hypothetical protein
MKNSWRAVSSRPIRITSVSVTPIAPIPTAMVIVLA